MKKYLLGAAAALALATPGVAGATETTGFVGLGWATLDDDGDSSKDGILSIEGAFVANAHGAWNVQFDANYGDMDHGSHSDAFTGVNAHGFYRTDAFAVGGFVGMFNNGGSSLYDVGVEAQLYLSRFTFGAAYTYADEYNGSGGWSSDIGTLEANGLFFLTPNTAFGANVSWTENDWSSQDGYVYGVGVEHQFAGSPFSIGARYTQADLDYNGGGDHDVESFGVFGRWNFGTPDLQTRTNTGASMTGGASLVRDGILTW